MVLTLIKPITGIFQQITWSRSCDSNEMHAHRCNRLSHLQPCVTTTRGEVSCFRVTTVRRWEFEWISITRQNFRATLKHPTAMIPNAARLPATGQIAERKMLVGVLSGFLNKVFERRRVLKAIQTEFVTWTNSPIQHQTTEPAKSNTQLLYAVWVWKSVSIRVNVSTDKNIRTFICFSWFSSRKTYGHRKLSAWSKNQLALPNSNPVYSAPWVERSWLGEFHTINRIWVKLCADEQRVSHTLCNKLLAYFIGSETAL